MAQTISVLIYDFNKIPSLVQNLRAEGIRSSDMDLYHKQPDTINQAFATLLDKPRILDDDIRAPLRSNDVSENEVHYAESRLEEGAALLMITVPDHSVERVVAILKQEKIVVPTDTQMTSGHVLRKGEVVGGRYPTGLTRLDKDISGRFKITEFDPKGWKVVDPNDEKIGDIKYILGNPTTGQPLLAVIDIGGLFKDKLVLVPFNRFQFNLSDKQAELPFEKEEIKNAPAFSEKEIDYSSFVSYWDQLRTRESFAHSER